MANKYHRHLLRDFYRKLIHDGVEDFHAAGIFFALRFLQPKVSSGNYLAREVKRRIYIMKKYLLLFCILLLTLSFLGSATANPIADPLPANTYITWNGLDWTWAAPVSQVNWGNGNVLSAPTFHEGWRFATIEEWTPFAALNGNTRLAMFTNANGGYINSVVYWNTSFTHVDASDMSGSAISRTLGGGALEMVYVRGGDEQAVPEPATIALFGLGLLGLAGVSRKQK